MLPWPKNYVIYGTATQSSLPAKVDNPVILANNALTRVYFTTTYAKLFFPVWTLTNQGNVQN